MEGSSYGRNEFRPNCSACSRCTTKFTGNPICSGYFDPKTFRFCITTTSQSIFKHILTEGDKVILTWLSPLQDQGGYAIAVNYGLLSTCGLKFRDQTFVLSGQVLL
jgi:hypothetical protein